MTVPVRISGGDHQGRLNDAHVFSNGALHTGTDLDLSTTALLEADNTVVEVIAPRAGQVVVVTSIIVSTNRDVGVNGATIDIYYAEANDSTDIANLLLQLVDFPKNNAISIVSIQLRVPPGNYVLAKTNDDNATVVLFYHYELEL